MEYDNRLDKEYSPNKKSSDSSKEELEDQLRKNNSIKLIKLKDEYSKQKVIFIMGALICTFFWFGLIISIDNSQMECLTSILTFISLTILGVYIGKKISPMRDQIRRLEISLGKRGPYTVSRIERHPEGTFHLEYSEYYQPPKSPEEEYYDNLWFFAYWGDNKCLSKGMDGIIEDLDETDFPLNSKLTVSSMDFQYLPPEQRYIQLDIIGNELPPYIFRKSFSPMGVLSKSKKGYGDKSIILGAYSSEEDLRELVKRCGFIIQDEGKSPSNSTKRQGIPEDVQIFVWNRDGGKCVSCGSNENLEFDHIIPISKGGSNTARNIQLLCQACNRLKRNNIGG